MDASLIFVAFIIILSSYNLLTKLYGQNNSRKAKRAPEPAGAWPIIGHLRLLSGSDQLLYRTLGDLSDKYGPVFGIRIGTRRAIVVSGSEESKECFTVNDRALASRPTTAAGKYMCYDSVMFGFAPYGEYWREIRKIVTLELLSNRRIEMLRPVWQPEITTGITELYGRCSSRDNGSGPVPLNLTKWFHNLAFNMIVKIVAGKRFYGLLESSERPCRSDINNEAERFRKAIGQFFHLMGVFEVSDAIPFLRWMDRYEKAMKETGKDLDSVLLGWLEEHRARRAFGEVRVRTERDFIDVMISLEEEGCFSKFGYDADTCIKSTCQSMILGGSDTTPVTMTWAVALLLNNRHVLKRAQEELDKVVGTDRLVNSSDIRNLPYFQAVVKETFRLYPAAPLLVPHESIEDCTIGGYNVPAGTRLLVNQWKIQRDPKVWPDPEEFRPERFLKGHVDVDLKGQNFEFIPFGSGRRSCPATSFALQVTHLTLGQLLHGFDISNPTDEPSDMTESPGLTLPKAVPLEVLLAPRLRPEAYV